MLKLVIRLEGVKLFWQNFCNIESNMKKLIIMMSLFLGLAVISQAQTVTNNEKKTEAKVTKTATADNAATGEESKKTEAKTTTKSGKKCSAEANGKKCAKGKSCCKGKTSAKNANGAQNSNTKTEAKKECSKGRTCCKGKTKS